MCMRNWMVEITWFSLECDQPDFCMGVLGIYIGKPIKQRNLCPLSIKM